MKLVITFILVWTMGLMAQAGKMKQLYTSHQEAVLEHLGEQVYIDDWTFRNTKFVKAGPGNDIAISSELHSFNPELNRPLVLTCVTEFYQVAPERFDLAYVGCH